MLASFRLSVLSDSIIVRLSGTGPARAVLWAIFRSVMCLPLMILARLLLAR